MRKQLLTGITLALVLSASLPAESIQGNFDLNYVTVHYTYEVRDSSSADDSLATYAITASWPSSASPMYTHTLKGFSVGDTIATTLVPLVTPELLAAFGYILTGDPTAPGVALNIDMNDNGRFTINDGSTYPTTSTINCSTAAVIPNVAEFGTWLSTQGFTDPTDSKAYKMGWGITLSGIFAQFQPADLINDTLGVQFGPGTAMENWGMLTAHYSDDAHTQLSWLDVYWEAHDGVSSGLGVDSEGKFNGHTGVPVVSVDTTTIPYIASLNPAINVSTDYGMLGGPGIKTDSVGATGDTVYTGVFPANHGYLFDPMGDDGIPFSGDEALQFTGYYFTKNFLTAAGTFGAVATPIITANPLDFDSAFTAAATAIAYTFAATAADSAAAPTIGAGVGAAMTASVAADLSNLGAISASGPTQSLGGLASALASGAFSVNVNDSDHDMLLDGTTANGRLIYEVDNVCIPDNTTQRVNPHFLYTGVMSVDRDAPIASEFKLLGNYPNPFNPVTKIKFALDRFSDVTVKIYSLLGEEVATLYQGNLVAGTYDVKWSGKDNQGYSVPSGVYFYEVKSDNRTAQGKMLLLK
ncbi:MAG: T9SS type A sorting domain-containing protein [Candidatus Marinimicrobia bacterium]|jgi:hypothetical protein|nr:T9SS type A sorting domain-containing protein [Candidatus Neomarinimicrobiota bacterium]MBT3618034.1 T9SS type A sorting domain-containing protein [Candidatus Neomarinimicrobiota bacterium]MBT3828509.1 T9SS type A sorting domain-containing protein [Candidatus Neomarinimicrobiota bacterium]MBT3998020.1 T9SS type A sorting domain-containing protein [Candidatus Neomarinimicrobiota bacterium]MBT4280276.1 T9SS type A sorting domain-containing protein [Candidatus Neomarinimicrobiota bacterium]